MKRAIFLFVFILVLTIVTAQLSVNNEKHTVETYNKKVTLFEKLSELTSAISEKISSTYEKTAVTYRKLSGLSSENQTLTVNSSGFQLFVNSSDENLLEKYAPVLYFHPDEQFFPTTIDAMLEESDLKRVKKLAQIPPEIKDPIIDEIPVEVKSLSYENVTDEYYLDMRDASGGFVGANVPDSNRFQKNNFNVYSREYKQDEQNIIIQYWFFYPFNDWTNKHEGDWEMVQVILNASKEPTLVTFSFHHNARTFNWSKIDKSDGSHPKVYVAHGGHASYWDTEDHSYNSFAENLSVEGPILFPEVNYTLTSISNNTSWIHYAGIWGEKNLLTGTSGPNSPANIQYGEDQLNRWNNPIEFAEDSIPSQISAITGSPVNMHAYDEEGRHVGLNESGELEVEIPNTYLYIPSNNSKELIVILSDENINFVINSTDNGTFNLSINKIKKNISTEIDIVYNNIQITNETVAYLNINPTNPNFIITIDHNADGIIDNTITPTNKTIEGDGTTNEADSDNDGFADSLDNCPTLYNPNQITDFDIDGFDHLLCGGLDCDDNDALINPNAEELCNNIDDNCNDDVDENLIRACGETNTGICTFGTETCDSGNWVNCNAVFPQQETCNNLDDDCDNEIDEGFDSGGVCFIGVGECKREGVFTCGNNSESSCSAVPGEPSPELCDGKDNDCDGIIDNKCPRFTKEQAIVLLNNLKEDVECRNRWFRWNCIERDIDRAISYIEKSLSNEYWVDAETLHKRKGENVFRNERKAAIRCSFGKLRFNEQAKAVCDEVVDYLTIADKRFAEKALEDARSTDIENERNRRCYNRKLKIAERFFDHGNRYLDSHWSSISITFYRISWKYSQKAINC